MRKVLILQFSLIMLTVAAQAGTYQDVVAILNNSCAFSSCHDASNPIAGLDLSLTGTDLYTQIVNVVPQNSAAAAKNNFLIKPGDPGRSYLYRKMNWGLHEDSNIDASEGQPMPTGSALTEKDRELVRQWILFGARNNTTTYVDPNVIEEYYTIGGLTPLVPPAPPAADEGFQLHFGPIFLEPGEEIEYVYKYELQNDEAFEVPRIDLQMNAESHHFLFFDFNSGAANNQNDGLIPVGLSSGGNAITYDTRMIGGWAYSRDLALPNGTAYTIEENTVLKYNYHIANYSQTSILPAEVYINVYTQDIGEAVMEMQSEFAIQIDPGSGDGFLWTQGQSTHNWHLTEFGNFPGNSDIHFWSLGSHTHQWGTDFDMYLNDGGNFGEQVYEGHYNFDYSFNQGFYDYGEPAFRVLDDFLTVKANDGLHIQAQYDNQSGGIVTFGLTTEDEMFGVFLQYLVGDLSLLPNPVSTQEIEQELIEVNLFPNPTNGMINLVSPKQVQNNSIVQVYNLQGQKIVDEYWLANDNFKTIDLSNFAKGSYVILVKNEEGIFTEKVSLQ